MSSVPSISYKCAHKEPTIQFHELLARNTAIPVVIVDIVPGIYASLRCLLGLDILADEVAEPASSKSQRASQLIKI
jgi:hypothetical protein